LSKTEKPEPTQAELEILQILWQHGPQPVRFVNQRLQEKRAVGYTTTLKLLQIMTEKRLVTRQSGGRGHLYRANLAREEVQDHMVGRLIATAFSGSAMNLVMQALGHHQPTAAEIEQLREMLDDMERGKP